MILEQTLPGFQIGHKLNCSDQGTLTEEIEGLIKVYENGFVERPLVMPCVAPCVEKRLDVTAQDVHINKVTNLWARIYAPRIERDVKLPLLVYFHGGGFCLDSAAWKCYHDFLGTLSSKARCLIISVNYRLAPENRLPYAYNDGIDALKWVKLKQQANCKHSKWWTKNCNFSNTFLAGDSAGANLAYHVALKLRDPRILKGIILIQPFIGGEKRTNSEETLVQTRKSALSLSVSDTYWRLALPQGANRDHPWCNPVETGTKKLGGLRVFVCIAEMDILKDRNMEMCRDLGKVGNKVECLMSKGVGHAFQVLDHSMIAQIRTQEIISHILEFISQ